MKEFNRNWNHITSEKLNVGDLCWWNFGTTYNKDWNLCIITDVNLDKADRQTRSQWWDYTYPSGRWNRAEDLLTNFVSNTARDNCKFNSITFHCPQKNIKNVVLLHPTYKEKGWRTDNLKDYFMTQNQMDAANAKQAHRDLCNQKKKELAAWWREENADFFEGDFKKEVEQANEGRARPRHYYAYDWARGAWTNFVNATYNADKEVYEGFMKSLESKSASAVDVLKELNNLIPDRLEVSQFTNGVALDREGKVQGRIDVKWRWSIEKTQQWFEKELNKDFHRCDLKIQNWLSNNCSVEVANDLTNEKVLQELAFTPQWFLNNVLDYNERKFISDNPDETLRSSEHPNVIGNGNSYQTSSWSYEL